MIKAKLYKEQLKPGVNALVNHVQGEWGNDKENCLDYSIQLLSNDVIDKKK